VTWERYVQERRPHWRERTYTDHLKVAQAGGREKVRGEGLTQPGPLAPLLVLPLAELTPAAVDAWAAREAKDRPARVRLALRMLKAFLRWAAAEPDLADRVNTAAASSKKAREAAGRSRAKDDVLLKEQLQAWFAQVRALPSRSVCAYLQCLLLLGCRREELLRLRWDDVNWRWKGLRLADKVEDTGREVPLTPYVATLLAGLPRITEWVFASGRPVSLQPQHVERRARYASRTGIQPEPLAQASASGRIADPSSAHRRACAAAGIEGLTLHGLRRSFKSLTEWLEVPVGVVAQIQGHKPSATVEKHYARRPLDLLRVHHERIERWVLEQAGVTFDASAAKGLQAVGGRAARAAIK
jgi:integrase